MRRALQRVVNFWTMGHYLIAKDSAVALRLKGERLEAAAQAQAQAQASGSGSGLPSPPPPPPPLFARNDSAGVGGGVGVGLGGDESDPLLLVSAMRRDIMAGGRATSFRGPDPYGMGQGLGQGMGLGQGAGRDVEEGAGLGLELGLEMEGEGDVEDSLSSKGRWLGRGRGSGVVRCELGVQSNVAVEPTVDGQGQVRSAGAVHVLVGYEGSCGDEEDGGEESDDDVAYAQLVQETQEAQAKAARGSHGHGQGRCEHESCGRGVPEDSRAPWERPTDSAEMSR
jgi:hypothetical protein